MALCLQPIQRLCVSMAGFLLWIYNLHRWHSYQPDLVHQFFDVCLEGIDYQLGEPPESNRIFWWTTSLLHQVYPSPELRLRIARRMMDIAGMILEKKFTFPGKKIHVPWKKYLQPLEKKFRLLWPCGPLVLWSSGPLVLWSSGPLVLWSSGPLVLWSWSSGPVVLWSSGPVVLVLWSCGPLAKA